MPLADLPQANRQHPVPQNIMDVEFKLIGDLTMRQFAYLFVFGLSAYLAYLIVIGIFKWPTVLILVLLGLGLAFVPVEERGLDEWIVSFFKAINTSTQRIWKKEPQVPQAFLYDSATIIKQEMITLAPTSSRRKLEEYLKYKVEGETEDPLDIPEKEYMLKVRKAYPYVAKSVPQGPAIGILVEEPLSEQPEVKEGSAKEKQIEEELEEGRLPQIPKVVEAAEKIEKKVEIPMVEAGVKVGMEEKKPLVVPILHEEQKATQAVPVAAVPGKQKVELRTQAEKVAKKEEFVLPKRFTQEEAGYSYKPITPDMHSGRKFVNLVPSQGELILPIRGERMLKTSEEIEIEDDSKDKAMQLEGLLKKIREQEGLAEIPGRKVVVSEGTEAGVEDLVEKLKQQNEDLNKEIQRLKNQIERGKSMSLETETQEQLLKRLESQKEKITSSYTELRQQVQELQKKLDEKATTTGPQNIAQKQGNIPIMTSAPDVLTGVVEDSAGKFLSDILVVVKNVRGEAVRALKTNIMGQFIATTPLQNGTYTVEVSSVNKTTLTFDIIPIEVKGEIIPPIEVIGR